LRGKGHGEAATKQWIAVVNQEAVLEKEAVHGDDESTGDARNPIAARRVPDASDMDTPGLQNDNEEARE